MAAGGYDPLKDLTCPVCRETFNVPKMLPCGHTVCQDPCLRQIAANSGGRNIRCPECRAQTDVPMADVSNFPTNFLIHRLLEGQKEFQKPKPKGPEKVRCPICSSSTYVFNCLHCGAEICEKCRSKHTTEMMAKTQYALNNLKTKTDDKQRLEPAKEVKSRLDKSVETMLQSVDDAMNNVVESIETRRQQLKDQIAEYAESERLAIDERQTRFRTKLAETAKFCESSDKNLTDMRSANQTDLFQLQCQIGRHKKHNAELQFDAALSTAATMQLPEDQMKATISTFGELAISDRIAVMDEDEEDFIPENLIPKQPPPKQTFASDADVLLYGLKRNKGRKRGGKR